MTFKSPFFEGTQAQEIINNYIGNSNNGFAPFPNPSPNPYVVGGTPFVPPSSQPSPDPAIPNCDELYPNEGRVYDPVLQACVLPEVAPEQNNGGNDRPEEMDRNERLYNEMLNDTGSIFGASNFLEDYVIDSTNGDIILDFDPSINKPPPFFGLGFADTIFGGEARRQNKFNEGMQSFVDQGYGQRLNNGTYQIYDPQQYFDTVQGNQLQSFVNGQRQPNITVGQAVDSVMNPQPQDGSKSSGSPIAKDMSGGLLGRSPLTSVDSQGNRTRNDTAYRASIARNIERNKRNFGNSKFKEGVGFMGGR